MKYLSEQTVLAAYDLLAKLDLPKEIRTSINIILIIKSLGVSNLKPIRKDLIKDSYGYAFNFGSLFAPGESSPCDDERCNFINPFYPKTGNKLSISESLDQWMPARVINNIFGGGTQWRSFIKEEKNPDGSEIFKFSYNYVDEIRKLFKGAKIDLVALAVWFCRFKAFENEANIGSIIAYFKKETNLTDNEINAFFTTGSAIALSYSDKMFRTSVIRDKIGLPEGTDPSWLNEQSQVSTSASTKTPTHERFINMENETLSVTALKTVLEQYYQVILSGPPGTSKSFLANEVGAEYAEVLHIQFHPQYSYQEFIGGYVVEGQNVEFKQGAFIDFVDIALSAENSGKKYLVIIDEINRANTSQVFGDAIQTLDRGATVRLSLGKRVINDFHLPKNLYIIGTMNTTDKSVGSMDLALKRRFTELYCPPDPNVLLKLCPPENGFISLTDFLRKLNKKLISVTKNREFVVGHALFLQDFVKKEDGLFHWDYDKFQTLFNYKILPMVEDYCDYNFDQIKVVLGSELPNRLTDSEFKSALINFMNAE